MELDLAIWVVAGFLAAMFLAGGLGKLLVPKEEYVTFPAGGPADDLSLRTFKGIGALEILCAAGLIFPAIIDIDTVMAPLAAVALAVAVISTATTRAYLGVLP